MDTILKPTNHRRVSTDRLNRVCVCVFFPFILDIKFVGRTRRGHKGGRSHRISHPPSSAVHASIFLARRIQSVLSLVDRHVEFCVLTIY